MDLLYISAMGTVQGSFLCIKAILTGDIDWNRKKAHEFKSAEIFSGKNAG
jgi:hypothetical protein